MIFADFFIKRIPPGRHPSDEKYFPADPAFVLQKASAAIFTTATLHS